MKTEKLRVFKIVLLFISLFVINIIFFKIISLLGFSIIMTDLSFGASVICNNCIVIN